MANDLAAIARSPIAWPEIILYVHKKHLNLSHKSIVYFFVYTLSMQ